MRGAETQWSLTKKLNHLLEHDGSSEVQLGQTHVMGFVTCQLLQPYRDRPNEGSLSIFIEFSPMADPSFELGRPGESAVLVGTNNRSWSKGKQGSGYGVSLCTSQEVSLGYRNLVDAANIAALAALLTFQRPECSLGGEDGQEVILHPPEEREPLPLIEHHLPIAVTFGFFSSESIMVIDPTHHEEAVMAGKMTATLNANGDLASKTASDITKKINDAVEAYKTERALIKIKFHPASITLEGIGPGGNLKGKQNKLKGVSVLSRNLMERSKLAFEGSCASQNDGEGETKLSELGGNKRDDSVGERKPTELKLEESPEDNNSASMEIDAAEAGLQKDGPKTLKDAVKPKHKRKKLDELQPLEFIKISLCM
ncbi:hypothetical protein QYF36_012088 [Acer negundo]|nr:hypothetical protein QYF36_012088 [Acer negundo]